MIKIKQNGRPFDPRRFAEVLSAKALEMGMQAIETRARGAASSIVDPETGRHADVFVDRLPGNGVAIRTAGSPGFARLIEKRLGVGAGEVDMINAADGAAHPRVYLAHASEDKPMVRPITEHLMANGVEVWFDEWDIEAGGSLRQEMEKGLGWMTHFAVVLTPTSITKPWVAREIDVGIVQLVGGKSRMVPLRVGVEIGELSPFLQTMLCPAFDPTSDADRKSLVDRLHGVSRKPPLGDKPSYVQTAPEGLSGWSPAARVVGRHLVEMSEHAMSHDPILTVEQLAAATGLDRDDVKVAVLDLKDAGYLWEGSIPGHVAAERALFVDFDEAYMPFSPAEDAPVVANRMVTAQDRVSGTQALAEALGWPPRRMNSAICFLERAGVIETRHALASKPWRSVQLVRTDRTLRFARSHG